MQGIVWTAGGNNKLLYCGAQDQSVSVLETTAYPNKIFNVHKMSANIYTQMLGKFSRCSQEIFFQTLHVHNVHAMFPGTNVSNVSRYYTYTMFEACALWIVKLIQGEMSALPDKVGFQRFQHH